MITKVIVVLEEEYELDEARIHGVYINIHDAVAKKLKLKKQRYTGRINLLKFELKGKEWNNYLKELVRHEEVLNKWKSILGDKNVPGNHNKKPRC